METRMPPNALIFPIHKVNDDGDNKKNPQSDPHSLIEVFARTENPIWIFTTNQRIQYRQRLRTQCKHNYTYTWQQRIQRDTAQVCEL